MSARERERGCDREVADEGVWAFDTGGGSALDRRALGARVQSVVKRLFFLSFAFALSQAAAHAQISVSSPAFTSGGVIPEKFTCNGGNTSPPLHIANVPSQAKSVALVVDDPDAPSGTFTHWLVWKIDPKTAEIAE